MVLNQIEAPSTWARSSSSGQSIVYVNAEGAGATSSVTTTSSSGESSRQKAVFVPGATSASASITTNGSSESSNISLTVSAPAKDVPQTPTSTIDITLISPDTAPTPTNAAGNNNEDDVLTLDTAVSDSGDTATNSSDLTQSTTAETTLNLVLQIGSDQDNMLTSTDEQDLMTGYAGADIFKLSANSKGSITDITKADIITDFNVGEDTLQLSDGIAISDLSFEAVDLNGDTLAESTIIRFGQDNGILAVVLNTILPVGNVQEQTETSSIGSNDITATDATSVSGSVTAFVNDTGAGASSEVTVTSSSGETISSVDSIFTPGATSSESSSIVIATPEDVTITTDVNAPAQNTTSPTTELIAGEHLELASSSENPQPGESSPLEQSGTVDDGLNLVAQTGNEPSESGDSLPPCEDESIDFLIGSSSQDILISKDGRDVLIGYGDADTFILGPIGVAQLAKADIIVDFNLEEGDSLQFSPEISLDNDILLETVDLDNNGIVESTLVRLTNGNILAVAQGTVDPLGNTLLSTQVFSITETS